MAKGKGFSEDILKQAIAKGLAVKDTFAGNKRGLYDGHFEKETPKPARPTKYGNIVVPDPETGKPIHSKAEAKDRALYRQQLRAGLIISYSQQPEFMLTGGVKYVADHLLIYPDGKIVAHDSKGVETPEFRIKWKQVQELYPQIIFTKTEKKAKPKRGFSRKK